MNVTQLKYVLEVAGSSSMREAVIRKLLREYQLEFTPLMKRETYVYVWETHKLADREEVSIEKMQEYPCVSFDQD